MGNSVQKKNFGDYLIAVSLSLGFVFLFIAMYLEYGSKKSDTGRYYIDEIQSVSTLIENNQPVNTGDFPKIYLDKNNFWVYSVEVNKRIALSERLSKYKLMLVPPGYKVVPVQNTTTTTAQ